MNQSDLQEVAEFASALAKDIGAYLLDARSQAVFSVSKKGPTDLVTSADLESERRLLAAISAHYPEHMVLSEESVSTLSAEDMESGGLWVIDPIDGTTNFAHGLPHVAVSLAFVYQGRPAIGVVSAPFLGEHYVGISRSGSFCNGERLKCGDETDLRNALIATGFPYSREKNELDTLIAELRAVLANCRDIRRNGSAALDICHVATGSLNAYYETVMPWDAAAARLIATESGAMVGNRLPCTYVPQALNPNGLVVAQPGIFHQLQELLDKAASSHS